VVAIPARLRRATWEQADDDSAEVYRLLRDAIAARGTITSECQRTWPRHRSGLLPRLQEATRARLAQAGRVLRPAP